MKKYLIWGLVVFMVFSSSVMAFDAVEQYSDVERSTPYYNSISWASDEGITTGYRDGTFGPDLCVNRAEFLRMMYETLQVDVNSYEAELFPDTLDGQWYTPYVKTARARGAMVGYPDGTARLDGNVNRVEAVKMAVLEFNDNQVPDYSEVYSSYSDIDQNEWYSSYLDYVLSANAIGLAHIEYIDLAERVDTTRAAISDGMNFFPAECMTRKEVVEMLYRLKTIQDNPRDYYSEWNEPEVINEDNLFYKSCESGVVDPIELEDVLPDDSVMVFAFDHTSNGQVEYVKNIFDHFPESGFKDMMIGLYNDSVTNSMAYDLAVKPILDEEWKFAMGVSLPDGVETLEDFENTNIEDIEMYLVFQVSEAEMFKEYAGRYIDNMLDADVSCSENDGLVYWTSEYDDFYMVRYGDVFVLTNTSNNREKVLERIADGTGFSFGTLAEEELVTEDNLGYFYLNAERTVGLINSFYEEMNLSSATMIDDQIDELGKIYMNLVAEEDALKFNSVLEILDTEGVFMDLYSNYELEIIDSVPDEGVIFYVEEPDFSTFFEAMTSELTMFMNNYASLFSMDSLDFYQESMDLMVDLFGISQSDLETLINSPVALAVSDVGAIYPAVSVYFDVEGKTDIASDFVDGMDLFIDDLILEYEAGEDLIDISVLRGETVEENLETDEDAQVDEIIVSDEAEIVEEVVVEPIIGLIKKEELDDGLRKVYLDLTVLAEDEQAVVLEMLGMWSEVTDIAELKLELYYGMTSDDLLVFTIYPEFDEVYGHSESLSENANFLLAKGNLDKLGADLIYTDMQALVGMIDKYVDFMGDAGYLTDYTVSDYEDSVRPYLTPFKYLISSGYLDGEKIYSTAYLRIEGEEGLSE